MTKRNPNANAARATGQNKARRNAAANARRGIATAPGGGGDGMAMEVERQTRRVAIPSGVPGGKNVARRVGGPSAAAVRAKARVLGGVVARQPAGGGAQQVGAITAPTQQAIGAAARAMKEHGFRVPKGMQMQISFVPRMQPATPATTTPPVFRTNNHGAGGGGRGSGRGGRGGGRGGRH